MKKLASAEIRHIWNSTENTSANTERSNNDLAKDTSNSGAHSRRTGTE